MRKLHFAALVATAALVPALAFAAGPTSTINAKAGQTTVVSAVGNCTNHLLLGSADGSALHGKVVATKTTRNFCGNPNEQVWSFFYTPNPGFKGDDQVTTYYGNVINTIHVVVQ